jgi:type IV pilus assembly protein PilQ
LASIGSIGGWNGSASTTATRYTERVSRALVAALIVTSHAAVADRDLCARGEVRRGTPIDLDVKDADVQDVLRLVADAGKINLVVSDDVKGRVTLSLRRAPWDAIACTIGALHHLSLIVQDNILLVRKR